MKFRKFGKTNLIVSEVGFGAWAIGGPFTGSDLALGWGKTNDTTSVQALISAVDNGINFIDTADFYGLGHSESLIGQTFGKNEKVLIATKAGHRLDKKGNIFIDYSRDYIIKACEESLKRLKRDWIDFFQLHVAKVSHLSTDSCLEAIELLKKSGKIHYWGVSLNTFHPEPEAEFLFDHKLSDGIQVVFNILNQKSVEIIQTAEELGFGVIARMPLQFGLLSGKFLPGTTFPANDHRSSRMREDILKEFLEILIPVWTKAEQAGFTKLQLALSYILGFSGISTVIPGIRTSKQAKENVNSIRELQKADMLFIKEWYNTNEKKIQELIKKAG